MKRLLLLMVVVQCVLTTHSETTLKDKAAFWEDFNTDWITRWSYSEAAKYNGKFESVKPAGWEDHGVKIPEKSKHYGLYSTLSSPVDPSEGLVVQYEVKYAEGVNCGGAYLKLLSDSADLDGASLDNDTPYTIMFGPDKCGATGKVHVIFRHKNPKTGTVTEKHLKNPPSPLTDDATHVYTLKVTPDNKFEVLIDGAVKSSGSLLGDDFDPKFSTPETIPDPTDKKPADWVDEAKIPDPDATKPDDWVEEEEIDDPKDKKPSSWQDDEPEVIPDPDAKQPEDWDEEEDGDWTAPDIPNPKCKKAGCGVWQPRRIPNPAYKGPWKAPLIPNPAYKGPWVQKTIANPEHYVENEPLKNIGKISAVAFELWTIDQGYTFDNILIATDAVVAQEARDTLWKPRSQQEKQYLKKDEEEDETKEAKGLAKMIVDAFHQEPLSKYKHLVAPFLAFLEHNEWVAWVLVISPMVLLIITVFVCLLSGGQAPVPDPVALRKKDLLPEEDREEDDEPAETTATGANADEDDEDAPEPSVVTTRTAAKSTRTVKTGEIVDADEDDEDDAKGPRRRRA